MKATPFRELAQFMFYVLDKIYNDSPQSRQAVLKHYGPLHYPYNEKFKYWRRKRKSQTGKP